VIESKDEIKANADSGPFEKSHIFSAFPFQVDAGSMLKIVGLLGTRRLWHPHYYLHPQISPRVTAALLDELPSIPRSDTTSFNHPV
jgi:hypothetical protein